MVGGCGCGTWEDMGHERRAKNTKAIIKRMRGLNRGGRSKGQCFVSHPIYMDTSYPEVNNGGSGPATGSIESDDEQGGDRATVNCALSNRLERVYHLKSEGHGEQWPMSTGNVRTNGAAIVTTWD